MKKISLLSLIVSLLPFFACRAAQLPKPSLSPANPPSHTLDNDFQAAGDSTADGYDSKPLTGINDDVNDNLNSNDTPLGENDWVFPGISSDEDLDTIMDISPSQEPSEKPAMPPGPKIEELAEKKAPDALENSQEEPNKQANRLLNAAIKREKAYIKNPPMFLQPKIEELAEEKAPDVLENSQEEPNKQANRLLNAAITREKAYMKNPPMFLQPKIEEPAEEKAPESEPENSEEEFNNQANKPLVVAVRDNELPVQKQNAANAVSVLNSFMQSNRNVPQAPVLKAKTASKVVAQLSANITKDIKKQADLRDATISDNMDVINCMKQSILILSKDTVNSKSSHKEKLKELKRSFDYFLTVSKKMTTQNIETQKEYLKSEKEIVDKNLTTVGSYLTQYHKEKRKQVKSQYYELKMQLKSAKKRFEMELESVAMAEHKLYKKRKRDQKEKERQALQVYEVKSKELLYQLDQAENDHEKKKLEIELQKLQEEEKNRRIWQAMVRKANKTNFQLKHALAKTKCDSKKKLIALKIETKKKLEKINVKREQLIADLKSKKNEEETRLELIQLRNENNAMSKKNEEEIRLELIQLRNKNNAIINDRKMQNKRIEEEALRKSLAAANKLFQDELDYARKAVKNYKSYTINFEKPYIDKKSGKVIPGKVSWNAKK